jgi:hypothetical protein
MVKIHANDECNSPFSVVGIMHWPGVSNIQDGVTVDLGHMNGIQVHTQGEDKVAKLGPGARWGYVYRALQILNLVFLEVLWIGLALATFYFEVSENPNILLTLMSLGVVAIVSCLTDGCWLWYRRDAIFPFSNGLCM